MEDDELAASLLNETKSSKKEKYNSGIVNINEDMERRLVFYVLVAVTEIFAGACVALSISWSVKYMGGFAWDGSGQMFNYHPVFMILGLVVFYGNAAITYRVLRYQRKSTVKLIHAFFQLGAFIFAVLGLVAVFGFHNHQNIPNAYSIHSWVGLGTVVLFSCQLLFGFMAFLFPRFSEEQRKKYLIIHVFFGAIIFALVIVSCISGITEKVLFGYMATYSQLPAPTVIANLLGLCIVIFSLFVGYILYHPSYKREVVHESYDEM